MYRCMFFCFEGNQLPNELALPWWVIKKCAGWRGIGGCHTFLLLFSWINQIIIMVSQCLTHYSNVIMNAIVSQITGVRLFLLNRLLVGRLKKTSKLRITGLCAGNSPGTGEFLAQMASNAENVSIWWRHHAENISIWWRHHVLEGSVCYIHNMNPFYKKSLRIQNQMFWQFFLFYVWWWCANHVTNCTRHWLSWQCKIVTWPGD